MTGRRIARIVFITAFVLLVAAVPVLAVDSDGDGVDDSFDNCRVHPNPVQTDSDGDGLGNRCDGDYDQSGFVDGHDVPLFTHLEIANDPAADLDGNGVVDRQDRRIMMRELLQGTPGPGAEPADDGDDLPLALDACPSSELGSPLLRGCSALDLSLRAREVIADPALEMLESAVDGFDAPPEYNIFLDFLQLARSHLFDGAGTTAQGDPCAGALTARRANDVLALAETELDERIEETTTELVRTHPVPPDAFEWTAVEEAMVRYDVLRALFEQAAAASQQAAAEIQAICDASTGAGQVQGIIESFDTERRIARLTSGEVVGLAEGYTPEPDTNGTSWELGPGIAVEADTTTFFDGTQIATRLRPDQTFPLAEIASVLCVDLRIRPFQLGPEYTDAPWVLHDPDGYRAFVDGRLNLERGVGLGIRENCPDGVVGRHLARYGARIKVRSPLGTVELASFLRDGESVSIPWIPADEEFEIEVTTRKSECALLPPHDCRATEDVLTRNWTAIIRKPGNYCEAEYSHTELDVQTVGQFRPTWVSGVELKGGVNGVPGAFFTALGYPVLPGGGRGDTLAVIGEGDGFAVLAEDFRDWHEAEGVAPSIIHTLTGTRVPSALVWPRVQGARFGGEFWYSCALPRITRDVITYCPDHPNTYYTSPLADPSTIIQGPFSAPGDSHEGAFAWDFTAGLLTPVFAAREGRVRVRISDSDETCPGGSCLGNRVILEHQDGTNANYLHLFKDTVAVGAYGTKVARGDLIGLSGNTGVSDGPHLHWGHEFGGKDLFDGSDDEPEPARFHTNLVVGTFAVPLTCYEPQEGNVIAPR